jgi:hypothetical protein
MLSEQLYLRIDPKKFHILKFILEGYDGLTLLSSFDMKKGLVFLRFSKDMRKEVFAVVSSLAVNLSPYSCQS